MFLRKIMLYPLRRGADYRKDACLTMRDDSSPLARGRRAGFVTQPLINRLIPSGEGADYTKKLSAVAKNDSSPLARGRQHIEQERTKENVIHPLLRGADAANNALSKSFIDSSPLARGRPSSCFRVESQIRFIPSCEGQTLFCGGAGGIAPIHPLLRGADAGQPSV